MMVFTTSIEGSVLFAFWDVQTPVQYAATCFFVFALAMVYELLSEFRARLHARTAPSSSGDQAPLVAHSVNVSSSAGGAFVFVADPWTLRLIKAALHTLQLGLSYIIMLIAMTYNVGYFLSMLAGAFVGYIAFARVRTHKRDDAGCCAVETDANQ